MRPARTRLDRRRLAVAGVLAALAGGSIALIGVDPDTPGTARAGVAAAGSEALSSCATAADASAPVDDFAARQIYAAELHGTETKADVGRITSSAELLSGLASANRQAVREAVHALVYAPGWHIVRLRVTNDGGQVMADVGGPYIIAPVRGALRRHGRTVGHYVMSVQDDVGYVKLVTRFIGVPIEIYRNGAPLMGTIARAPATMGRSAPLSVDGHDYLRQVLEMRAFPDGMLGVALLVPAPAGAAARESCAELRLAAWGAIAEHIAARFKPLAAHYENLVSVLRDITGDPAYVVSGSRRVAGRGRPAHLPARGGVTYAGRSWSVFSWSPSAGTRVYLLTRPG